MKLSLRDHLSQWMIKMRQVLSQETLGSNISVRNPMSRTFTRWQKKQKMVEECVLISFHLILRGRAMNILKRVVQVQTQCKCDDDVFFSFGIHWANDSRLSRPCFNPLYPSF